MPSFNMIARSFVALLFLSYASSSLGQESADGPTSFPPGWSLNCASADAASGELVCQIEQRFFRQQTRELVMILAITKKSKDATLSMDLVLPHGLDLLSGVSYQIDAGEIRTAAIGSSRQNGAVTSIPLSPDLLAALKVGRTLMLKMKTSAGREFSIPSSLVGLTAAIDRMTAIK